MKKVNEFEHLKMALNYEKKVTTYLHFYAKLTLNSLKKPTSFYLLIISIKIHIYLEHYFKKCW